MGVYPRGRIYWITFTGPSGQQVWESTGQSDARVAARILRERRRAVALGTWQALTPGAPTTLATWAETWLEAQRQRGLATMRDVEQRCRDHVLPVLGPMPVADMRPRHVVAFVEGLAQRMRAGELAPRSVRHVYDVLRSMMRDAVIAELRDATPCVLPPGTLPAARDADPAWRATAVYTRDELETLISDERIPLDRRVFYALELLTGVRFGEAAGRRWRDYDPDARPLGRLVVATQYEGRALKSPRGNAPIREIPVHPTLAAILADWRLSGFGRMLGRNPRPEDYIVPSRLGRVRSVRHMHRKMGEDAERVGIPHRRQHDTRRTFVTLCRADGARRDVLRAVTHGDRGDVFDSYTSWPWATLCESVSCLRVSRRRGEVVALPLHDNQHDSDRDGERIDQVSAGILSGVDGTRSRGTAPDSEQSRTVSRTKARKS